MAFVSLAIIALVAFASPFIASAIPGKPVPETVFLLVFGAVLGPHMLGLIHVDAEVSLVSELGLAFLFLLAGFEIDPKNITGVEGRYGLATWGRHVWYRLGLPCALPRGSRSAISTVSP